MELGPCPRPAEDRREPRERQQLLDARHELELRPLLVRRAVAREHRREVVLAASEATHGEPVGGEVVERRTASDQVEVGPDERPGAVQEVACVGIAVDDLEVAPQERRVGEALAARAQLASELHADLGDDLGVRPAILEAAERVPARQLDRALAGDAMEGPERQRVGLRPRSLAIGIEPLPERHDAAVQPISQHGQLGGSADRPVACVRPSCELDLRLDRGHAGARRRQAQRQTLGRQLEDRVRAVADESALVGEPRETQRDAGHLVGALGRPAPTIHQQRRPGVAHRSIV